jgi:gluconokinase
VVVIIMGVAGSGKTTVGVGLAAALGWPFHEGDADHPADNLAKMARGQPLTDDDRWPWLERLRARVAEALAARRNLVITCSALKASYRRRLRDRARDQIRDDIRFVYLEISPELAAERARRRQGHFMKESMVRSQFAALEAPAPDEALILDARLAPADLIARLRAALAAPDAGATPA